MIEEYFDLSREQKMLWNVKVTVKPIVVGELGTVRQKTVGIGDQSKNRYHTDQNIVNIS